MVEATSGHEAGRYDVSRVPKLASEAIRVGLRKAQSQQTELLAIIHNDPSFDSSLLVLGTFSAWLQQEIMAKRRAYYIVKDTAEFLEPILRASLKELEEKGKRVVNVNWRANNAANRIEKYHNSKKLDVPSIRDFVPELYDYMLRLARVVRYSRVGHQIEVGTDFLATPEAAIEREKNIIERWLSLFKTLENEQTLRPLEKTDLFVELLRGEPKVSFRTKLLGRIFAGISVGDIEKAPYPIRIREIDRTTEYLTGALSGELSGSDRDLIEILFFRPIIFYGSQGRIEYRNKNFLGNIHRWRERFVYHLLFSESQEQDAQTQALLRVMSPKAARLLVTNVVLLATRPFQYDPEFSFRSLENSSFLPLLIQRALKEYKEKYPQNVRDRISYIPKLGVYYLHTALLPRLRERLSNFGVLEKCEDEIAKAQANFVEKAPVGIEESPVKRYFEKQCGQYFIQQLNRYREEINTVGNTVWRSTLERGVHFLPLQQGQETIEFSKRSTPDIMGIKSLTMQLGGFPQEWKITITFRLQDPLVSIDGQLDQAGTLHLATPLEKVGLEIYSMLQHIAVLAFRDLAVQREVEREQRPGTKRVQDRGEQETTGSGRERPGGKVLPREQTDQELVTDVYRKTGFKPRRVALHVSYVKGAREYERKAVEYKQKVDAVSIEEIALARQELERARAGSSQPSLEKRLSAPARFRLKTITDPITGELRYLQTWIVEHTSPKPTAEELRSPVKLFERYYSRSSALASLDQFKPWFVAEHHPSKDRGNH